MTKPKKLTKGELMDVIAEGYKAGLGPRQLVKVTGKSRSLIQKYARELGLTCSTTRPKGPKETPAALLTAMFKSGLV